MSGQLGFTVTGTGVAAATQTPTAEPTDASPPAPSPDAAAATVSPAAYVNHPRVAVHAVGNLVRLGAGVVRPRWTQLGFGRTSSTSSAQATPRNLLGFRDGTANLKAENETALTRFAWVGDDDADWLAGGSYLVTRRIRTLTEDWDQVPVRQQEAVIGRTKAAGVPLGQREEFDPTDFTAVREGRPAIDGTTAPVGSTPDSSSSPTNATLRPASCRYSAT